MFAPRFCPTKTDAADPKDTLNADGIASIVLAALFPAVAATPKELIDDWI